VFGFSVESVYVAMLAKVEPQASEEPYPSGATDDDDVFVGGRTETPLGFLLGFLRLVGGFPFKLTWTSTAKSTDWLDLARPFVVPCLATAIMISINYKFAVDAPISEYNVHLLLGYVKMFTDISVTDMIALFVNSSLGIVTSFGFIALFFAKKESLLSTYRCLWTLRHALLGDAVVDGEDHRRHAKTIRRWFLSYFTFSFLMNMVASYFWGQFTWQTISDEKTSFTKVTVVLSTMVAFCSSLGPLFVSSLVLFMDLVATLEATITFWTEKICLEATGSREDPEALVSLVKRAVKNSEKLRDFGDHLNVLLAPFLVVMHTHILVGGILTLYGASGFFLNFYEAAEVTIQHEKDTGKDMLTLVESEEKKLQLARFAIPYFGIYALLYFSLIQILGQVGTTLASRAEVATERMRDILGGLIKDPMAKKDLVHAAAELPAACVIRPYDAFAVSNGNTMAMCTALFTYTVVLAQFRVAEKPSISSIQPSPSILPSELATTTASTSAMTAT
jgi:hypothetical protein